MKISSLDGLGALSLVIVRAAHAAIDAWVPLVNVG